MVFEPNDEPLWAKVRASVDDWLLEQWRAGALLGATPEEAYFVNVGLGETMTEADLREGRLNISVGFAPLRPAEFVVIHITHDMSDEP